MVLIIISQECKVTKKKIKHKSLYGCLCPSKADKDLCQKIQTSVHGNPCIGKNFNQLYDIFVHFTILDELLVNFQENNNDDFLLFWRIFNKYLKKRSSIPATKKLTTSYVSQTSSQQFVDMPIATSVYVNSLTSGNAVKQFIT